MNQLMFIEGESPARKRKVVIEERHDILEKFVEFMGPHFDKSYLMPYLALYQKMGNLEEVEAELEKAERELEVLESEAKVCDSTLGVNVPIKPLPHRASAVAQTHHSANVNSLLAFGAGSVGQHVLPS
jgi:hypothetical protein